jgi:hypothetical protein
MRNIIISLSALDKVKECTRNKLLCFLIVNEPFHEHTRYVDADKNSYIEFTLIEKDAMEFYSKHKNIVSTMYCPDSFNEKGPKCIQVGITTFLTESDSFFIQTLLKHYKVKEALDIINNPIEVREIYMGKV